MTRKLTRISWWQWKHYEHCRIMLWPSFSGAINTHLVLGVVCGGVVLYVHRGIILPGLVLSDRSWPGNIMGGGIYVVRLIYLTKLQKHLSELIPNSCLHCSQRLFLLLHLLLLRALSTQSDPYQALMTIDTKHRKKTTESESENKNWRSKIKILVHGIWANNIKS